MLIKMKCAVSGPRYTYKAGQEVDHPDEKEARRWISVGVAVAVSPTDAPVETAVAPTAPERAVSRQRRRNARPTAH